MTTRNEIDLMSQIADRGIRMAAVSGPVLKKLDTMMDLEYANRAIPMDLEQFLDFKPSDFAHDFNGIYANLNRETKQMDNCFTPRCAIGDESRLMALQANWEGNGGYLMNETNLDGTVTRCVRHSDGYSLFRYFKIAGDWVVSVDLDNVTLELFIIHLMGPRS